MEDDVKSAITQTAQWISGRWTSTNDREALIRHAVEKAFLPFLTEREFRIRRSLLAEARIAILKAGNDDEFHSAGDSLIAASVLLRLEPSR